VARSRREVFETHADRNRTARCPICRQAIEQDHEEALGMQTVGTPASSPPPEPASAPAEEREAAVAVGFALV